MSKRALIVIDMLQTYEHEDAERLRDNVEAILPRLSNLVARARGQDAPVIYVNDSFGDWRGDRASFLEQVAHGPHSDLVEPLLPDEKALFITKARHSIFPRDAVAHIHENLATASLEMMERNMEAEVVDASDVSFEAE